MNNDTIENLLRQTDSAAPRPASVRPDELATLVIYRARHRHTGTVIAILILGVGTLFGVNVLNTRRHQRQTAAMQAQIAELQEQTSATLALVRRRLDQQRQEERLARLEAQLAAIQDPLSAAQSIRDQSAARLVQEADRSLNELNQPSQARWLYRQCIDLYPDNPWAKTAAERLDALNSNTTQLNRI